MKDYICFFILFTLLEITLTVTYYLLVKTFDTRMLIGGLIYTGGMIAAYVAYRGEIFRKQRKELLDALP